MEDIQTKRRQLLDSINYTNNTNISQLCTNEYCVSDEDYIEMIEAYIFPTPYEWVLISLHITVFAVGLVGNSLVCISVYRNHSMRTVTNYFIVNLAVADFLVILVCLPPSVLWDVTETWFFGGIMCKLVLYFQSVSVSVSVLTLTFISIDRWYAICYPFKFKSTAGKAKAAIFSIWITSLLLVLPDVIVLDTRMHPSLKVETHYLTDCAYTWSDDNTQIYQLVIVLILYVAPFALMSVLYYQIARVLWNKNIPGSGESELTNRSPKKTERNGALRHTTSQATFAGQIRSRRKAAKMLIAVIVMFGLCYLPVHLINTLRYTTGLPQTHSTTVASLISHWLCYANSAINPLIYNFMSGKFRKEFRNTFTCMCWREGYRGRSRTPVNAYFCRYTTATKGNEGNFCQKQRYH
ncbi:orexin receptor type 1-like isoform X2 [Centruroides sculpturatus]|uniref:orexin receptor type 1-like isoform X2 n=1 Tax=Centruroides sculpturatus TaxID=218467 RepID=UPI000C6E638C|nr:orexin receptor type 1-like isoform X2 [Centruroides sculpturatus]